MSLTDQFASRVVIADDVKLTASSGYGLKTVGQAATQITGAKTETSLFVQGAKTNADVVYLGLDDQVSASNYFATLDPGEKLEFTINTDAPMAIYAIGTDANDKVAYLEGMI